MIDTHAHLYLKDYDDDLDAVIHRAHHVGVEKIILPGIQSVHLDDMLRLKNTYPDLFSLAVGIHPCHTHEVELAKELKHTEDFLMQHDEVICAIGEIGIDLYWDPATLPVQIEAFEAQLDLAHKYNKPIIIHCREGFDEAFKVLDRKAPEIKGVFHCFTGTLEHAKTIVERKMKLGIGGVVTFKNTHLKEVLKQIPLESILLETDAPYLAPTPYRGKRNESSYLVEIVSALSNIYETSETEIIQKTTQTANQLFLL